MASSQALNGEDAETAENSLSQGENENISEVKDDKNLRCTNNCEDNSFEIERALDEHEVEDVGDSEVDVTDCRDTASEIFQEEDPEATEYSSSFSGSVSGSENGFASSDVEVESHFNSEKESSAVFDGFRRFLPTKKKRLTAQWRRFIRPLMWRCKWIELRVKELQLQASKYDLELLAYANEKQLRIGQLASVSPVARSMPFSEPSERKQVMKRRKRKRMEETVDIPSYMSRHSLFAYYENKRHQAEGGTNDDDCGNQDLNKKTCDVFGIYSDWPLRLTGEDDSSLELSLWNIELLQSRVEKLKSQLDNVIGKNGGLSSSAENLSNFLHSELPHRSALSLSIAATNGGQKEGLVGPESAISSSRAVTPLPDVIESTVGLLSAVGRSLDQPQKGDFTENVGDDILINNQAMKEESKNFEKVAQSIERKQEPVKQYEEEKAVVNVLERDVVTVSELAAVEEPETGITPKRRRLKSVLRIGLSPEISIPKNKRKRRVRRRPGSGRWSRGKVYKRRSKLPDAK
ncbi:uncharacterized protein [Aristolochia californica]|uniref:uncharacterized protein n=1 Tax=Aristolochia californica TaxID=171875 RepID=UPI0035D5F27E